MTIPLRILLLEDNPSDAELAQQLLEADHFVCEITCVQSRAGFVAALESAELDLILADYSLPSFDGLSALRLAQSARPNVPFIFVSGTLGEEVAIEALKIGATDYVLKTHMSRLVPAVQRALREFRERAEREQAEAAAQRSEKELRDVVETIPAMVWSALPDGTVDFMNRRWRDFTGLSMEESLGWSWVSAIHPEDVEPYMAQWDACATTGQPFKAEVRIRCAADGAYRWFLEDAVPLRDDQGNILKWYGFVVDMEDRKRAEEAARRNAEELRQVIETIPAMVWSARPDGSVDFINRRWQEFTGLSQEELLGWSWASAIHPDDVEKDVANWRASVATGRPFEMEARRRRSDGEYRWFSDRAVALRDEHGKIVKWYGTLTDIEDRKRAEQERDRLRQLEADLAHMSRVMMMGELAASLAHEIRQPITAAVMNAEACKRWLQHDVPEVAPAVQAASGVVANVTRASDIIDRVRSLYIRGTPQWEPLDLNEVIREVILMLSDTAKRNQVSIHTEEDGALPKATGDRVQLQQVLMNLVLNGIEAMKDTGGELSVAPKRAEDGQLLIAVSDTGMGLPSDGAGRVFDAFFTTKPKGTGMGLCISRRIIETHGGRLWAISNAGRGATFQFTLPGAAAPMRQAL